MAIVGEIDLGGCHLHHFHPSGVEIEPVLEVKEYIQAARQLLVFASAESEEAPNKDDPPLAE
jgi:hypothetical protein